MLSYTTDRARPGLVALYDIRPGNRAGQLLQPRSLHEAVFVEIISSTNRRPHGWLIGWGLMAFSAQIGNIVP